MTNQQPLVKAKQRTHYHSSRNFDLAAKVAHLPDYALIDAFEAAAISGIAVSSFQKPEQRKQIELPEPTDVGRLKKWRLHSIVEWMNRRNSRDFTPLGNTVNPKEVPMKNNRGNSTASKRILSKGGSL